MAELNEMHFVWHLYKSQKNTESIHDRYNNHTYWPFEKMLKALSLEREFIITESYLICINVKLFSLIVQCITSIFDLILNSWKSAHRIFGG